MISNKFVENNSNLNHIDSSILVRERKASQKWKWANSIIEDALNAKELSDDPLAGIKRMMSLVTGEKDVSWFRLPDWQKLDALYASDNNSPLYDDVRQLLEFNEHANFNSSGATFHSRRNITYQLLKDRFATGVQAVSIGSGSASVELQALKDSGSQKARLICIDLSKEALDAAKRHAAYLGISGQVVYRKEDAFAPNWSLTEEFDLAVSVGFAMNYLKDKLMVNLLSKLTVCQ